MLRFKHSQGFSLVELLIVLSIMMTMIGLVGGTVIDGVARARAQTEVVSIYGLLRKASISAFAMGQPVVVSFEGYFATTIAGASSETYEARFEFLSFDTQEVVFHRNGLPSTSELRVEVRGVVKTIDFASVFTAERQISEGKL